MPDAPVVDGVYETVLYGADVRELARFYADVVGLRVIEVGELLAALRIPDGGVLLLFDPSLSSAAGRTVPSHGATGEGHVAFSVPGADLDRWREHLGACAVEIESVVEWGGGPVSIYVRDPAGNSVEFTAGELWGCAHGGG